MLLQVAHLEALDQRKRDERGTFGFFTSASTIAGRRIHSRLSAIFRKISSSRCRIEQIRLDLVDRQAARLQNGEADELVRVADQDPALLLARRCSASLIFSGTVIVEIRL